ncbi:MAG: hypothetical protein NTV63_04210 [Candidatus Woesearchaeota archaeon]|nr:hypothetical protein [Candidatus Woesearchaeota archaeon]
MQPSQKLEDITSKEYLDKTLENAKSWCLNNLPKHLQGFQNGLDYDIFHYVIDNEMIGSDMCLDNKEEGLIRVSTRKLQWYIEREKYFGQYGHKEPETDSESMFIHEITEFLVHKIPEVFSHYFSKMEFPHSVARKIENINRRERGLKEWYMG